MMLDRILIKDLLLRAIVGINDDERTNRQDVVINLVLEADTRPAARSDDIADAVNYRTVAKEVIDLVGNGFFSPEDAGLFRPLVANLLDHDEYMVLEDFEAYVTCQKKVSEAYLDRRAWHAMAVRNRIFGRSSLSVGCQPSMRSPSHAAAGKSAPSR